MSATTCSKAWDDIWSEFDARQDSSSSFAKPMTPGVGALTPHQAEPLPPGARGAPDRLNQLIVMKRNKTLPRRRSFLDSPADARTTQAEPHRPIATNPPKRGFGRFKRVIAVILLTMVAVYTGSPMASAVQVAAAIQRGGAAALAHHIEWQSLRPALNAALAAEVQRNDSQPMPSFITGMAQDMAERLSSPAGLGILLSERLPASGAQPAREMLSRLRMLEAGLWEVTLNSPNAPDRSVKLTLALTDVARLRWEVQAIELPAQLPSRLR